MAKKQGLNREPGPYAKAHLKKAKKAAPKKKAAAKPADDG